MFAGPASAQSEPMAQASPSVQGNPVPAAETTEFTKRFPVSKIEVSGNSVIGSDQIAAIVTPYEGKDLSLDDLRRVASQISELYRAKGYFLSAAYVPNQDVTNGVARIDVVEGKIGSVSEY